jgi:hypothetical protein
VIRQDEEEEEFRFGLDLENDSRNTSQCPLRLIAVRSFLAPASQTQTTIF